MKTFSVFSQPGLASSEGLKQKKGVGDCFRPLDRNPSHPVLCVWLGLFSWLLLQRMHKSTQVCKPHSVFCCCFKSIMKQMNEASVKFAGLSPGSLPTWWAKQTWHHDFVSVLLSLKQSPTNRLAFYEARFAAVGVKWKHCQIDIRGLYL